MCIITCVYVNHNKFASVKFEAALQSMTKGVLDSITTISGEIVTIKVHLSHHCLASQAHRPASSYNNSEMTILTHTHTHLLPRSAHKLVCYMLLQWTVSPSPGQISTSVSVEFGLLADGGDCHCPSAVAWHEYSQHTHS